MGGKAIKEAFQTGLWKCFDGDTEVPIIEEHIGPNSLDIQLGRELLIPKGEDAGIRPNADSVKYDTINLYHNQIGYLLHPRSFVLGGSRYRYECSAEFGWNLWVPMYDGRSTMGRLGLGSHITAGKGDYGFNGNWTLEIYNFAPYPIILTENMKIGQITFHAVWRPTRYEGTYKDDRGPHGAELGPTRV